MNEWTDQQLLRDYAERRSESAFGELTRRHIDLVYSAALRITRDPDRSRDVSQGVFVALAQNAREVAKHPVLSGWLHRTTRNIACQTIRTETRRRAREQEAAAMIETTSDDADWKQIAPQLDDALTELSEPDRDALMLRYFERKSAREIAQILGVNDEAAQKRVNRAVERLRQIFAKRGISTGAGGLAAAVSAHAVEAAPAGLAAAVGTAAVAGISTQSSTALAATKLIAMTTLQKAAVAAALAAGAGAAIFQTQKAGGLRGEVQSLRDQRALLSAEIGQLQKARDSATNRIALLAGELERAQSNSSELLRLRSETARLREAAKDFDSPEPEMKKWASQVALLKRKLEQMPNRKIPELKFLTEKDWANAAWGADLSTEDGVREALSKLREDAINTFLNEMMKDAMKKYLAAHNNIAPPDLYQLKPYFDAPVTDDMLASYQLLQSGPVDNSADLVKLTAHADDQYDSNHGMSINGAWGGGYNHAASAVNSAMTSFLTANNGQMPSDPSQLLPYLKQTLDPATIQKYMGQYSAPDAPPPEVRQMLAAYGNANNGQMPANAADLLPYVNAQMLPALMKLQPDFGPVASALQAYWAANNGQAPKSPSDLTPYLTTPEQKTMFQKLVSSGPGK